MRFEVFYVHRLFNYVSSPIPFGLLFNGSQTLVFIEFPKKLVKSISVSYLQVGLRWGSKTFNVQDYVNSRYHSWKNLDLEALLDFYYFELNL